ncbi:hypothetical protein WA026_002935 [Henosepilachna vigintioctopunctata]|uniref:Uncharacterized protein n=1 Tax=Henosepilachna vigintioctopunctata TaxID=420089 RepID=A0AAW1TGY4_9CUCU
MVRNGLSQVTIKIRKMWKDDIGADGRSPCEKKWTESNFVGTAEGKGTKLKTAGIHRGTWNARGWTQDFHVEVSRNKKTKTHNEKRRWRPKYWGDRGPK